MRLLRSLGIAGAWQIECLVFNIEVNLVQEAIRLHSEGNKRLPVKVLLPLLPCRHFTLAGIKTFNSVSGKSTLPCRMQFFHLEHPLDEMMVCDRDGCEAIADYLEVEDDETEQCLCAVHTRSHKCASGLPVRASNRRVPYRSVPVV